MYFLNDLLDSCKNYTQETYPQIINKPYSYNYRQHLMVSTVADIQSEQRRRRE